mmetsp:Transcript_132243/g.300491  ORF Transcript_132243/g.300491 Transcript_132243/m.300491 type:complete len:474 (-) Transcript_132243:189-1610(-)
MVEGRTSPGPDAATTVQRTQDAVRQLFDRCVEAIDLLQREVDTLRQEEVEVGHVGSQAEGLRSRLEAQASALQRELHFLKARSDESQSVSVPRAVLNKPVRVFMDGAFDIMHYGHMNAFRLGRALGDELYVGVNDDDTITACKAPPIMNDRERQAAVAACRFVTKVIPGSPYVMTEEYLEFLFREYEIDFVVHGDDPCIVDGKDVYAAAKSMGRYQSIPRTEGVSTTDVVGRMLLMTKEHHTNRKEAGLLPHQAGTPLIKAAESTQPITRAKSQFLPTTQVLRLFSNQIKPPAPGQSIVYVPGSWDMFHAGHIELLERCRALGDYVIVGVYSDFLVNQDLGMNYPIMNQLERCLSVIGCHHVDDVVLDAPWTVSDALIKSLNVSVVVDGRLVDMSGQRTEEHNPFVPDPFESLRPSGAVQVVEIKSETSVSNIVSRVAHNRDRWEQRQAAKAKAEEGFWQEKHANAANGQACH